MMFRSSRRPLAIVTASLVAACAIALGTGGAKADTVGSLVVDPATGADTGGITLTTSGGCPEPATNLLVSVAGSGFPADGQNVVSNSPVSAYGTSAGGGIAVPLTQTMRDYASTAGFTTLQGRYDFTLTCRAAFGSATYGDFTAAIWFTSDTAYQNTAPAVTTTTALASAPAGPVVVGTAVKLTATVTPAAAAGSVRFLDGSAPLGTPVPVSGGTASLTTSGLAVGGHSLKAEFTPSDPSVFRPSASAVTSYTVKIKPPTVVTWPKVTGTARVGSTVTCAAALSGATTLGYSWLRDSTLVTGATTRTRALAAADYRHKISCRVTASNSTGTTRATSPAVTVALGPALKATVRPSITGTARVGQRLTAKPGTWKPAATSYGYVWKRNGVAIRGAVYSTYVLTGADRGRLITVTVNGRRAGYASGSATSGQVRVS